MYQELFDQQKQEEMRRYFLSLARQGIIKKFAADEIVEIDTGDNFGIVVAGKLKQSLYSQKGSEKVLYILQPGEIFGEMDYFSSGRNNIFGRAMEEVKISIINRLVLEKELARNPLAYRFFLHSVSRKFRIVMLQMASLVFNDSLGKLSDLLLRLSSQQGKEEEGGLLIDIKLTHEDIASLIGCSRATVTRELNKLKSEGIIAIKNKKIIILNQKALFQYIIFCCR